MELERKWKFLSAAAFNLLLFAVFYFLPSVSEMLSEESLILIQGVVNSAIIGLIKEKS